MARRGADRAESAGSQRRVAKLCAAYGQKVQKSVFECMVGPAQWARLKHALEQEIHPEKDTLRFYFRGANWRTKVEHVGARPGYDPEGPLIL